VPTAASERLWNSLARPFDLGEMSEALLGIPSTVARALADMAISTGDEADRLLLDMPSTLRRLRMGSTQNAERSASGIRGPVLWGQTIAARSSSLGHSGVYVCSVPGRVYDVMENRLLVESLRMIAKSGERVQLSVGAFGTTADEAAKAKANAETASRYLGHRSLAQVGSFDRRGRRNWRSLGSGRNSAPYQPAVALLEKVVEPVELGALLDLSAPGTDSQHRLLMTAIDTAGSMGVAIPPLRCEGETLIVGSCDYVHPYSGLTGDRSVGLLRGADMVVALDPTGAGPDHLDANLVGSRHLTMAETEADMARVTNQLFN